MKKIFNRFLYEIFCKKFLNFYGYIKADLNCFMIDDETFSDILASVTLTLLLKKESD